MSGGAFPSVDLEPGMDLEAAHERTLKTFEDAGHLVTEGQLTVTNSPIAGVAEWFNILGDDGVYAGIVYPGEWDEEDAVAILNYAARVRVDSTVDGLVLVTATEPPDVIQYVTGTHSRGAFALEAKLEIQNGPEFTPESAPHFADIGQELLETHFNIEIDVDDPDGLARLDDVVLEELRTVDEPDRPEEGHVPQEALITIGTLAGRIMRRGLERDLPVTTDWDTEPYASSMGVVIILEREDDGEEASINPVGKGFKRFESGNGDSFVELYQTTREIAANEL